MFAELRKCVDAVVCGSFFELLRANNIVEAKIKECTVEQFTSDERLGHSVGRLDDALAISVERVRRIETKAMGTLLGVAVAIAVLGAGSGLGGPTGLLCRQSTTVRAVAAVLLVAAMVYLFGSGLLALRAYEAGELYHPALSDRAPLVSSKDQALVLLYCIEQNERVGTVRSNRLSAAFSWLRNGLVVVLLLGCLIMIVAFLGNPACHVEPI
jgi:hypothetical protein